MIKKYLDTTAFTYAILYDDEKADRCKDLMKKVAKGFVLGFTSVITWDEVVYTVKKTLGKEIALEEGKKFLNFPNLRSIKLDKNILQRAQELIQEYSLDPRDAIHVATAILNDIKEIISDDSDFDSVEEIKRIKLEEVNQL